MSSQSNPTHTTATINSRSSSQRSQGPQSRIRSRRRLKSKSLRIQSQNTRTRCKSSKGSWTITSRNSPRDYRLTLMNHLATKSSENSSRSSRLKRPKSTFASGEFRELLQENHQGRAHAKNHPLRKGSLMTKTSPQSKLQSPHFRVPPRVSSSKRFRKSRAKRKIG